jgi:hypothetical protein
LGVSFKFGRGLFAFIAGIGAGDKGRVWLHGRLLGDESSAHVAQSVEHILGKDEVTGSNPVMGSPLSDGGREKAENGFNKRRLEVTGIAGRGQQTQVTLRSNDHG